MKSSSERSIERVAALLATAYRTLEPVPGVESLGDDMPLSVDDGYAIQRRMRELAGIEPGAWKIGATSELAQQLLGVEAPFIGVIAHDRVVASGTVFVIGESFVGEPAIEAEVGLRPSIDLAELPDDPLDLAGVVEVVPCIEIVNSRFGAIVGPPAACLIADDGVASALVIGEPLDLSAAEIRGLDRVAVTLSAPGTDPVEGTGAMALGHPLRALHTAATLAAGLGTPIGRGQIVTTGTCTGLTPIAPGVAAEGSVGDQPVRVEFR